MSWQRVLLYWVPPWRTATFMRLWSVVRLGLFSRNTSRRSCSRVSEKLRQAAYGSRGGLSKELFGGSGDGSRSAAFLRISCPRESARSPCLLAKVSATKRSPESSISLRARSKFICITFSTSLRSQAENNYLTLLATTRIYFWHDQKSKGTSKKYQKP